MGWKGNGVNTSTLCLVPCTFEDLEPWVALAKRDGLVFSASTEYWEVCLKDEDSVIGVGMCGVQWWGRSCRFKNAWLVPRARKHGWLPLMIAARIALARERGVTRIRATCTPASVRQYLDAGFEAAKLYKNGCTEVVLHL